MNSARHSTIRKKEGKLHKIFETSFDWKECKAMHFIEQKSDYMPAGKGRHWNPGKDNKLVNVPEAYPHSSARFHITGVQGICKVTSCMKLNDIDLTGTL